MTVEPLATEQDAARAAPLHLPDLTIRGFRGIDELEIPRLGRVTLLAGKNGVGKTTVLDAVRVFASRARYGTLGERLRDRDEVSPVLDDDGRRVLEPDWGALFHGRNAVDSRISIGGRDEHLRIDTTRPSAFLSEDESTRLARVIPRAVADDGLQTLKVAFQGLEWLLPCFIEPDGSSISLFDRYSRGMMRPNWFRPGDEPPPEITCESLGPGLMANEVIAPLWDNVALSDDEDQAVRALSLVLPGDVDGISMIGDDRGRREWRRAIVKLASHERPVPLKSLGDGAMRLFGVALAIANSRDGFLLIDEVENGLHHTLQRDLWRMVLQAAHENNVQVLATAHSWDCVRGFAHAASENEDAEGLLVRIRRVPAGLRAVEYSEERLRVAAEQGIEVR